MQSAGFALCSQRLKKMISLLVSLPQMLISIPEGQVSDLYFGSICHSGNLYHFQVKFISHLTVQ